MGTEVQSYIMSIYPIFYILESLKNKNRYEDLFLKTAKQQDKYHISI